MRELPSEICPADIFNHDGENEDALFYQTKKGSIDDALTYGPKFRCLGNRDEYMTIGNFDTSQADIFKVVFE